jgi:pyruvate/2-oxoglutarate dehydrogenase complex dihydrolipoamide acyltransferase (E2) component
MRPDAAAADAAPSSSMPVGRAPPDSLPLDCAPLARDLRSSLDEVVASVERGYALVGAVEDALGLERAEGERPGAAEQAAARDALPATLGALADVDSQLQRLVWALTRARRRLAGALLEGGQGA